MSTKQVNILLVEDDELDVMNIRRAFARNNIANPVFVAGNGEEALELLRSGSINPVPKIILLDINMPRMNGIEFLKEMRKDPLFQSISIFVMTTSNEESDVIEAYKFNVAGYILKPVSFDKFVSAISTLNAYWQLIELPN